MSTRATIACKQNDGRYAATYVHFDGYPERTGRILNRHYTEQAGAESLVSDGDIRCFDDDGVPERYKDGHATEIVPTYAALLTVAERRTAEFVYVFEGGKWDCHTM